MILVLKVDPDLVLARQTAEPVLYVGNQTAERVNIGYRSGHVVALVPHLPDEPLNLKTAPIWFGTPELPERCDKDRIRRERAKADAAGVKPFRIDKITAALKKGGKRLEAANRFELRRKLAPVIQQYSPQETDLIAALRVPLTE